MSDKPASPARGRKKTAPPAQQPPQEEVVVRLPLTDLYPFPDHPFQVRDDEEMKETIQSVKEYGVIVPAIVRPREEGGYEIVAGHRRKYACEQAGLDTMPVLIRNLDRDAATIIMVDSNLQRENILPSERAKAYKMKLEAIKRQGARNDLTSPKISAKLRSDDEIGQQMGVSGDTVRNYISLTNLVPELMQMVDEKKIALSPAYQIAALKPEEQQMLVTTIDYEQATPSLSQAQRMKKWYEEALHAVAVQYGLTMNELSVLLFLANNPALNTARDIVQLRALAKSHVCMSVDALARRGLLAQQTDEKDKRRVRLFVTKAGQPAARAGQAAQQAFFARLHAGVTAEEFGVLRTVLGKMLQNAQGEDQYGV